MATTPRRANISSEIMEPVLDLSFNDIESMSEATTVEPRITSPRKTTKKAPLIEESSSSTKKKCNSVRLAYNKLCSTDGCAAALAELMDDPHEELKWLDLSFNSLTHIEPEWCDYKNLQILYLHGNNISDLKEVDKLTGLKSLRKLTLHGNSIENEADYKKYVVSKLPHLTSLDFSTLTKGDRDTVATYQRMGGAKQKKKSNKEEN